ncbi:hypothetical protein SF23_07500 [Streptomyces sp. MBRL 10]|nr:hypothetical protein SF23_07500 [Streptomyces sp. MBRL 10]
MPSEWLGAYRLDRAVLASGIVLVADCALRSLGPEPAAPWATVLGWGLVLVGWLVLGLRSSYPVAVAAVSLVAAVGCYQITTADGPAPMIVFMVALYTVARAGRPVAVVASSQRSWCSSGTASSSPSATSARSTTWRSHSSAAGSSA